MDKVHNGSKSKSSSKGSKGRNTTAVNIQFIHKNQSIIPPQNSMIEIDKQSQKEELVIEDLKGGFEDGRLSRFCYLRTQNIDKACSLLTTLSIILVAIYFDTSFDPQKRFIAITLLQLNSGISLLLIFSLYILKQSQLDLLKSQLLVAKDATMVNHRGELQDYFFEVLTVLIQPYSFFEDTYYNSTDLYDKVGFVFKFNHFLCIFQLTKVLIVFRMILNSTMYATPRAKRLHTMYGSDDSGYTFHIKCLFKDQPLKALGILFLFQIVYFALALRFAEMSVNALQGQEEDDSMSFKSYNNCMWCIIITMTTVGYGDYHPRTLLGRLLITFISIWGIFTVSLTIVALTQTLQLSQIEETTLTIIQGLAKKQEYMDRASEILVQLRQVSIQGKRDQKLRIARQDYSLFQEETEVTSELANERVKLKEKVEDFKQVGRQIRALYKRSALQDCVDQLFASLKDSIKILRQNSLNIQYYINLNLKKDKVSNYSQKMQQFQR